MNLEPFNSAYFEANTFYDLEMPPEKFEEIGLVAWRKIGNRYRKLYRYHTDIDKETLSIELPCNCDIIEAVTYDWEDWKYTTNLTVNGDYNSLFTENYIEGRKLYNNPLYMSGKYAKYERVGDTLYFDKDYGNVNIMYKGVVLDEDGLPFINEKEREAIACYCAMTLKFKEGWKNNNLILLQNAQLLEQRWNKLCEAARVKMAFSLNEMNDILNVKSSWNRKSYNKSYKPIY